MAEALTFLQSGFTPRCRATIAGYFNFYSLALLTDKSIGISYNDAHYEMTGQWVWSVYPGPWIEVTPHYNAGWWEHRFVNFGAPLLNRWIAADIWLTQPQPVPDGAGFKALFDELAACSASLDRWSVMRATNLLEYILLVLAGQRAHAARTEPWLETALRRIDDGDGFTPNYAEIARECNMALSTLRHRFKLATGVPLHEHVVLRRMAKARELLQDSDLSIKAIASRLGYRDVAYFARQFQSQCGVTPGLYRRSGGFR